MSAGGPGSGPKGLPWLCNGTDIALSVGVKRVNNQRVPTAPGRSERQELNIEAVEGFKLWRPRASPVRIRGRSPEDYNRPREKVLAEFPTFHSANFADRLCVLLALLAGVRPSPLPPPLEREAHAIYSVRRVWVRDLGSITGGYVIGRLRSGIRQRFGGSTAQRQERRGGAHSRLSRSVDSEVSEEVAAPSRGTRPYGPSRGGKCGSGYRGSCCWTDGARAEGPLAQGPSRSRSPARALVAGHWSAPGVGYVRSKTDINICQDV